MTSSAEVDETYAFCETRLKEGNYPAWLAALFAPADKRPWLHALGAFAIDIAEVRGKVREPLAGELRLQWWTDAIEGEARGDVRGHPIASALIDCIHRAHLPRAAVTDMIDARREDLYDDPLPSLDDYAKRADRIEGALLRLKAQALLGRPEAVVEAAAQHAGRAMAVVDTVRALTSRATPLHMTVPLALLRAQGIGAAEMLMRHSSPSIREALADLRRFAMNEIRSLRALRASIMPEVAPALLPANLVGPMLRQTRSRTYDPFATPIELTRVHQQWILWLSTWRSGLL